MRQEKDSLGTVQVPEGKLYGAQTVRSQTYFSWSPEVKALKKIRPYFFWGGAKKGKRDVIFSKSFPKAKK